MHSLQQQEEYRKWLKEAYELFQAEVRRQSLTRLESLTMNPLMCKNYREVYIDHEKWDKKFKEEINCEMKVLEEPKIYK